jgi:hypothetical protein
MYNIWETVQIIAVIVWIIYVSASVQSHRDRLKKLEEKNNGV